MGSSILNLCRFLSEGNQMLWLEIKELSNLKLKIAFAHSEEKEKQCFQVPVQRNLRMSKSKGKEGSPRFCVVRTVLGDVMNKPRITTTDILDSLNDTGSKISRQTLQQTLHKTVLENPDRIMSFWGPTRLMKL